MPPTVQNAIGQVPALAWAALLAAAALTNGHALLAGIECRLNIGEQLAGLPLVQRIKKKRSEYLSRAGLVMDNWPVVRAHCTQAERFSLEVVGVVV